MDPRVRTLLSWQLRFQSRRMATWIYGCGYLLVTLVLILFSPDIPTLPPGRLPFQILRVVHALTTILFAIVLAGDSMEDHLSGTLGFLKVAQLDSRSWVAFRVAATVIAFLPIWTLRLPIYALILSLGGVTFEEVLWVEVVQWVAFFTIASVALLVARYSTTASVGITSTVLIVVLLEVAFYCPMIAVAFAALIQSQPFRATNHPWALAIGQIPLTNWFWSRPSDTMTWGLALGGFALHLALAALFLRMLARVMFFNVGTEIVTEEPAPTKAERDSTTRPSRRVSDDPLAWQVCHVHAGTPLQARTAATVLGTLVVLAISFVLIDEVIPRTVVIGNACGLTLLILGFKPSDCLSRELKGKTLSTLALIPLDGREIYAGWLRGSRRLARPGYLAAAAGGALLTYMAPQAAPYVWMVFAFALLLLPEAAFLSNLMARKVSFLEFDFPQLFINLWMMFLIGVLLAVSLPIAIAVNAWAGLTTFIGLSFLVRSILLSDFPRYVAARVEREQ